MNELSEQFLGWCGSWKIQLHPANCCNITMPLGFFKWGIPFEYVIWMADMMIHQMLVSDEPKNSQGIWPTPCYLTLFHLLGVFSVWDYRSETSWWYSIAGAVSGGGGDDDVDDDDDDGDDDDDDDDVGYIK